MDKPKFDIKEHLRNRPLSWSQLSSFEYDPEQWYQSYIMGVRQQSKEMDFGSYVDKRLQDDPTFLPDVPRYEHMQYKMRAKLGWIPLVGIPDGLDLTTERKVIADFKTGKKKWDKKRADETGQLTFYLMLLYFTERHAPEDFECRIHWIPTEDKGDFTVGLAGDKVHTFVTKRTMQDIAVFAARIKKTVAEMESYVNSKAQ
jgi:hypothetical protein